MADEQSPPSIGDITPEEIERIVTLLVKCFCDNKVAKPLSGVAMIVLINRLEQEGYRFQLIPAIPIMEPSSELH